MPFLTLSEKGEIESTAPQSSDNPLGKRSTYLFHTGGNGVPRGQDLLKIRRLGQSYAVQLMKDTVKQQVTTTPFSVTPTSEEPTRVEEQAADNLENFLRGGFNDNKESFDHFLKKILDDVMDVDSGIVELVPDDDGYLSEMYVRDGITFTKNPDDHGRLPDAPQAAYYQFGLNHFAQRVISTENDLTLQDLAEHLNRYGAQSFNLRAHDPIEFSREQIVWFSESPNSWSPYGTGKTQKASMVAESLLKSNVHNLTWFTEDEYSDGVLALEDANQDELNRYREYWREKVRGNPHELPILGRNADYLQFDPTPEEMEFMDSQKWWVKLVAMIFGLNQNEIGDLADINRATAQEQAATVFRRTTKPLLDMIERKINNQILPKTREWDELPGDQPLEFQFQIDHPKMERLKFETDQKKLQSNVKTVNEVRDEMGKDQFGEWADLPQSAIDSIARNHPEWIAEKEGIDDVPTSGFGGGGGLFENNTHDDDDGNDSGEHSGEDGRSENRDDEDRRDLSYRQAFKNIDEIQKEALRNENYSGNFPPLKGHIDQFKKDVGKKFLETSDDVLEQVEAEWPEKGFDDDMKRKDLMARLSNILDKVNVRDRVSDVIIGANMKALEDSAEFHKDKVEKELEDMNDSPDADIEIDFDVQDTFAAERMRQRSLQSATEIEDAVTDQVRNTLLEGQENGWGTSKMANELEDQFEDMSQNHAELVARTETLSSSREGSQAMAESTDVIQGKEWVATDDSRTRAWHDAMDGTVESEDQDFVVPRVSDDQPTDYPRSTMVVGGDQPFNCRCSQAPVLDDEIGERASETSWLKVAEEYESLEVDLDITERQFEVWKEHGKPGESFADTWSRLVEEHDSITKMAEKEDLPSRQSIYDWNSEFGVNS